MNDSLISIIIPCYNVEKYLNKCLDSLINQTYTNLEIILIDDGSTDSTGEICDYYSSKDQRIIVKHTLNHGRGHARNEGLKCANGDYIGFIDSDDYVERDMYELLYLSLISNKTMISVCNFVREYPDYNQKQDMGNKIFNGKKECFNALNLPQIAWTNWNKLFSRELIFPKNKSKIIFDETIHQGQDGVFTLSVIDNSPDDISMCYINNYLYHYRLESQQDSNKKYNKGMITSLRADMLNIEVLEKNKINTDKLIVSFLYKCEKMKKMFDKNELNNSKIYKDALQMVPKYKKKLSIRIKFFLKKILYFLKNE